VTVTVGHIARGGPRARVARLSPESDAAAMGTGPPVGGHEVVYGSMGRSRVLRARPPWLLLSGFLARDGVTSSIEPIEAIGGFGIFSPYLARAGGRGLATLSLSKQEKNNDQLKRGREAKKIKSQRR